MSSSRPVPWVSQVLYGLVLVAGLYAELAGLGDTDLPVFLGGFAALAVLEVWGDRFAARVVFAARAVLLVVIALADGSGLARVLLVLIPFHAYFVFGRRVSVWVGVSCVGLAVAGSALSPPGLAGDAEQLGDLLMFALGVALAIAMAAAAVDEKRYRARIAELSIVEERNRLARDIHDDLGHHLTAIVVLLEKASAFRDRDPPAAQRALDDAARSARQALTQVRRSVSTLRSESAAFSVVAALRDLVHSPAAAVGGVGVGGVGVGGFADRGGVDAGPGGEVGTGDGRAGGAVGDRDGGVGGWVGDAGGGAGGRVGGLGGVGSEVGGASVGSGAGGRAGDGGVGVGVGCEAGDGIGSRAGGEVGDAAGGRVGGGAGRGLGGGGAGGVGDGGVEGGGGVGGDGVGGRVDDEVRGAAARIGAAGGAGGRAAGDVGRGLSDGGAGLGGGVSAGVGSRVEAGGLGGGVGSHVGGVGSGLGDAAGDVGRGLSDGGVGVEGVDGAGTTVGRVDGVVGGAAGPAGGDIVLEIFGEEDGHGMGAREALYRAAQEGITNARRHAGASRIGVRLRFYADRAELCVTDDGHGFVPGREGFGLRGMRERVVAVGGEVSVESAAGRGTKISVTIPKWTVP